MSEEVVGEKQGRPNQADVVHGALRLRCTKAENDDRWPDTTQKLAGW
ncbi:MAG: hypothetical protein AABZ78_13550 [Chloroflexota bacterium]